MSAEYVTVTFINQDFSDHSVTVAPPVAKWEHANSNRRGAEGARRSIMTFYVLPALIRTYPDAGYSSAWWDKFWRHPGETFTAPPHRNDADEPTDHQSAPANASVAATSRRTVTFRVPVTKEGNPKCRCLEFKHCEPHDGGRS